MSAETILFGGNILTMEDNQPEAEAIAVRDRVIVALGALTGVMELAGEETEFIYLNEHTLLPGFIEAHQHALIRLKETSKATNVGAYSCKTVGEVMKRIRERVNSLLPLAGNVPPPWCIFTGWDPELIPHLPSLDTDYIEREFSAEIPIVIIAQNLHACFGNRKLLELAGVTDNSELKSFALLSNSPYPSKDSVSNTLTGVYRDYSSRGFTTVTELGYAPQDMLDELVCEAAAKRDCPVRLAIYQIEKEGEIIQQLHQLKSPDIDKLWMAGVKLWADGSPHSGTMAVREPFLKSCLTEFLSFPEPPNYGKLHFQRDCLYDKVSYYHTLGAQMAIHAHGERAIEQVLGAYERVNPVRNDKVRHRIEHLGLATEQQLARCASLGLSPSFFVDHLRLYGSTFSEYLLGAERTDRWAPLASAIRLGCTISIHQDHPAFPGPPLPFANIRTAVTRSEGDDCKVVHGAQQCISIHEAVKAYTVGPAWQLFREDKLGSLKVGKFADFVILSQNPYSVPPEQLTGIRVVETYIGGVCNGWSKKKEVRVPTIRTLESS